MTYADVLEYTYKWYSPDEHKTLQDLAFQNKTDINGLLIRVNAGLELPTEVYINKIRKNLKKKSKKFRVSKKFNIGNLMTFGVSSLDEETQRMFIIPQKDDLGYIQFRFFKKSKLINSMFNKLTMALKSSKVRFNREVLPKNGTWYIKFSVENALDNETFWGVLNLWSKK